MEFKILYAISDSPESVETCRRFLEACLHKNYKIKIAAYYNVNMPFFIDWNLNSLKPIFGHKTFDNDNLRIYYDQIKAYSPDLIITDIEEYTSYIATQMNIPIWNVSSLFSYLMINKTRNNLNKISNYYKSIIDNHIINNKITLFKSNSDKNIAYTYLCDYSGNYTLKEEYDIVRPYHYTGSYNRACEYNITSAAEKMQAINFIKNYNDCVLFMKNDEDRYSGLFIKNYYTSSDYACNIHNSKYIVSDADINYIADAFYNNKYSFIFTNHKSINSIINGQLAQYLDMATCLYNDKKIDMQNFTLKVKPSINNKYVFLHEKIDQEFSL